MFTGPLFVVGAPRSGTKLLRDLLRQHPRVAIPLYETEFLPRFAAQAGQLGDLSDRARFDRFYAWVSRNMYFRYMADDGTCITADQWYRAVDRFDVQGIFEALIRHDGPAPRGSAVIWGDKSPNYREHLPTLHALWPEARFIHIIRDVRDVCLSSHKAWGKSIVRNAQRWMDELSACREAGHALGAAYHELRYEDLLAEPEDALRRICAFLELDFDPAMLRPGRVSENLGDTRGQDRIVADNAQKWRKGMSPALLRRVEAIAGPLLSELHYPLSCGAQPPERVSAPELGALRLLDGANLVRFRLKEWGLRDTVRYSLAAWESTRV